jgi:small subunit ribosomal protein S1
MLWELLQSADHADATVIGRIREPNQGGFTVDLGGVQAFLPRSLSSHLRFSESSREQTLEFKIVEFPNRRGRDLVLSRRKLAEQRFTALSIGQRVDGLGSGIVEYGAFIDLGGFDGLLHKSEMGKGYGAVPLEILAEGQRVTVVVVAIDRDRRRVRLRLSRDGEK